MSTVTSTHMSNIQGSQHRTHTYYTHHTPLLLFLFSFFPRDSCFVCVCLGSIASFCHSPGVFAIQCRTEFHGELLFYIESPGAQAFLHNFLGHPLPTTILYFISFNSSTPPPSYYCVSRSVSPSAVEQHVGLATIVRVHSGVHWFHGGVVVLKPLLGVRVTGGTV
jgi:hypothetical protein